MRGFRIIAAVLLIAGGLLAPAGSASAGQPRYAGYLFVYFTGEGTADGEQVYFGLSQGNDPVRWQEPSGRPALLSTLGTKGIRDPFVIRSPRGDRFYLIATDLRMYGSDDWDQAQRRGSRSIVVWESKDLVRWSEPRLVEVARKPRATCGRRRCSTTRRAASTWCSGHPRSTRPTIPGTPPSPTTG
jgi:hypothetical protein